MSTWSVRVRSVVADRFWLVLALLVVVGLVGAWLTVGVVTADATTTERRVTGSWTTVGHFDHEATVSRPNSVYERGTQLENRSLYLTSIAPAMDGAFVFQTRASDAADLDVNVTVRSQRTHLYEREGPGRQEATVVWQQSERRAQRTVTDVGAGEPVQVPFSLNVSEWHNRTLATNRELGDPPGDTRHAVTAVVRLNGTVNGRPVQEIRRYEMPMTVDFGSYSPRATPTRQTRNVTEAVSVPVSPGPGRTLLGPALLVVALGACFGLGAVRWRGTLEPSATERQQTRFERERQEHQEWLVRMTPPPGVDDRPTVEAESLEDLVDYAIDTGQAVIDRTDAPEFVVLDKQYTYVYYPPAEVAGECIEEPLATNDEPPEKPSASRGSSETAEGDGPIPAIRPVASGDDPEAPEPAR